MFYWSFSENSSLQEKNSQKTISSIQYRVSQFQNPEVFPSHKTMFSPYDIHAYDLEMHRKTAPVLRCNYIILVLDQSLDGEILKMNSWLMGEEA